MDAVIATLMDIQFRLKYLNAVKEKMPTEHKKPYEMAISELCKVFTYLCHNDGKCKDIALFSYDAIIVLDFTVFY